MKLGLKPPPHQASCRYIFVRVTGDSMTGAGIHSGAQTRRSAQALRGPVGNESFVADGVTVVAGEQHTCLLRSNKNYQPIEIQTQQSFEIWGVVTNVIHAL
jgi:DNA polymerase V